jgi:amidase
MARMVSDVALLLSAIAGSDSRCPIGISDMGARFAGKLDRGFKGVRVAWFKNMGGIPFESKVLSKVNAQKKILGSSGCILRNRTTPRSHRPTPSVTPP